MDLTVDDVTISGDTGDRQGHLRRRIQREDDTLQLEKAGASWRISSLQS